jgi:hypothetical protein
LPYLGKTMCESQRERVRACVCVCVRERGDRQTDRKATRFFEKEKIAPGKWFLFKKGDRIYRESERERKREKGREREREGRLPNLFSGMHASQVYLMPVCAEGGREKEIDR